MLRRRPLMRPRPLRPPLARPGPLQALAQANDLLEAGEPAAAAPIFERLSEGARAHGFPARSANLALQAARAHLEAGQVSAACHWALAGLTRLAHSGQCGRVPRVLGRICAALEEAGHPAEAAELRGQVAQALSDMGLSLEQLAPAGAPMAAGAAATIPTLPARCSGCGAPLIPDEIEWRDAHSALCPYCGTVAKAA